MADGFELVRSYILDEFSISEPAAYRAACGAGIADALEVGPHRLRALLDAHSETWGATMVEALVSALSIWLPVDCFRRLPVLLPHVLRDNGCRKEWCGAGHMKGSRGVGLRDLWSTPSPEGYVRDDNSLVKNLVNKAVAVSSRMDTLDGQKLVDDFVACHIDPMAAATDPWLNSFVPNLVWLPKPLDVFSDRNGQPVQAMLRRRSEMIYGISSTGLGYNPWDVAKQGVSIEPHDAFNLFLIPSAWLQRRMSKIRCISRILAARIRGEAVEGSGSGHTHYDQHLEELDPELLRPLTARLETYAAGME